MHPGGASQSSAIDAERKNQRAEYLRALDDLKHNRNTEFRRRTANLADYVLAPYLEYHAYNRRVNQLTAQELNRFVERHADFPFANRLRNRWLLRLPAQGRWQDYLKNYQPSSSATRRCYHLRAIYRSGQRKAALEQTASLWLHGKSQPKACDPLFRAWISAGYLTDRLVWERINLALERNEVTLTRYLLTLMKSAPLKKKARLLYQAHVRPQTLFDPAAHRDDNETNRAILKTGLQRLARKDPAGARTIWRRIENTHTFTDADRQSIEARLLIEGAQENIYPAVAERPIGLPDKTLARVAREAVRQQNWPEARHWIAAMSAEQRAEAEWRYWAERSAEAPQADLAALATERNYYGFLAAIELGAESRLNHDPSNVAEELLLAVRALPEIDRALELYAVDDLLNARREWRQGFARLNNDQKAAAAKLAQRSGWLDQAIMAANAAALHNDLDLRFPRAHNQLYDQASAATHLPKSTLLAVTRQESAFQQRARSTANARGLMQLLPSTARQYARHAGLPRPSTVDLYQPAINIRIASEYLARLMKRYNQQRPLAFAAYNAGEHRVDRWIKDREGMPMEVWIETIPFRETRGYVKSVLAFNHLYSKRMNNPVPLFLPHERKVL